MSCELCVAINQERPLWGDGPWQLEPDNYLEFNHAGLLCCCHRGLSGIWCGYVAIPELIVLKNKLLLEDTFDNLSVHGGITYREDHLTCYTDHNPTITPPKLYWLGFDCGHGYDIVPLFGDKQLPDAQYRTLAYVQAETRRLAEQLAQRCLTNNHS